MLALRNFTNEDILTLQINRYPSEKPRDIQEKIELWNSKNDDGKFYEMFGIFDDSKLVGMLSLYQHSKYVISCGPEVFEKYQRKGYGTEAMQIAINVARDLGYKIAVAQIRNDNTASIRLHKGLGFELDHEFVNKKGNEVGFYMKYIGEM